MKNILLALVLLAVVTVALPAQDQQVGFTAKVFEWPSFGAAPVNGPYPVLYKYLMTFTTDDPTVSIISGEAICKHLNGATEWPETKIAAPVGVSRTGRAFITCYKPSTILINVVEVRQISRKLNVEAKAEEN